MRGFGLTAEDFYVRLSDRDLWIHYLRAAGFSETEVPDVLSAVDKFEKLGDAAFKGFEDKHGALTVARREAVTGLLSVRGFEARGGPGLGRAGLRGGPAPAAAPANGAAL